MEILSSPFQPDSLGEQLHALYQTGDCVECAQRSLPDGCIDLMITDPPYGIKGHTLHKHYNRNEGLVLDGYQEIPEAEYYDFSLRWIHEAERVLRPGGSMYLVSGWSHLRHILNALESTRLQIVNHIIWKYNFGVFTRQKFTTSHYHILYVTKPGEKRTFHSYSRYGSQDKTETLRSRLFTDMEDVWIINREYKTGKIRHKNELPSQLLIKMIQYSSQEGDWLCDFFAGSFSLAKMAKGLNRNSISFEISPEACAHQTKETDRLEWGFLLHSPEIPWGNDDRPKNQGKPWSPDELEALRVAYLQGTQQKLGKRAIIQQLQDQFQRGYFSILNALKPFSL